MAADNVCFKAESSENLNNGITLPQLAAASESNAPQTSENVTGFRRLVESSTSVFGPMSLVVVFRMAIAEMVGSALLVLLGCMGGAVGLPATPASLLVIALGFGFVVMLIIQTIGHISKCHINPAVTTGLLIFGDISIPLALVYVFSQCIGAILGYGTLLAVLPAHLPHNLSNAELCVTQPAPQITNFQAVLVEMILTGVLVFVACGVFDWRNATRTDSVPIKFGLTVAALALMGGPYTGASMNPARSLGPVVWTGVWKNHWIYWVGPLAGSILFSTFYRFVFMIAEPEPEPEEKESDQEFPLTAVQSQENNEK